MSGFKVAKIDDIEGAYGGALQARRARRSRISSFGIQVIDMPPNVDGYPEHDHALRRPGARSTPRCAVGADAVDGERHARRRLA